MNDIKIKLFKVLTRCVYYQKQSIQDSAGGNSHTGCIRLINLETVAACISERAHHILLHSQIFNKKNMKKRSETGSAAGGYLEPVSGTQQRTLHSRSSRTLRLDSGADTRPHFPARGGRREGTGSRSDIDLLTGRLGIFPGTETRRHSALSGTNNPQRQNSASPSPCTCPHTCPQTCFG